MSEVVRAALEDRRIGDRLWLYANYRCNLTCSYCLTESAPGASPRLLPDDDMLALAEQGRDLGFAALGVTGGEPFLVKQMPETVARLAEVLPTIVLTNGTLFDGARLGRLTALVGLDVKVHISLDRSEPVTNDEMRGPHNFRKVLEAIPRLLELGVGVRIASTLAYVDEGDMAALCALHRSLGVRDEDHIVRGVLRRGRAATEGLGEAAGVGELRPELTITADGSFWSPFAPTVRGGRLDTDLLLTRQTRPLRVAAEALVQVIDSTGYAGPADDRFR